VRYQIWSESWQAPATWLETLEREVRSAGATALRGSVFDPWDLEVSGGMIGSCRLRMAVEEHGAGRQLIRFRSWPRPRPFVLAVLALLAAGAVDARLSRAGIAFGFLATSTLFVAILVVRQCGAALAAIDRASRRIGTRQRAEAPAREDPRPIRVRVEQMQ